MRLSKLFFTSLRDLRHNARPIALLDPLRFGPLSDPRNRYLFDGVVRGIASYGNSLGLPTVGVTHRPLVAAGEPPGRRRGARSPLRVEGEEVGWWLRTRAGARALAVSPGWATDLDAAVRVVEATVVRVRTPEPLRQARRLARTARGRR